MFGDRWTVLSPLLDELLELGEDARALRLSEIETSDPELAAELKKLIALEGERPDFLAQPIVDGAVYSPQPGQQVGPYRMVMPLGEGGMGQVWLAVRADGLYERRVALKLLRPGLGDAGLRARFTRERQILARLGHAHIARLLDAGVSQDGQPYLALDYIRGDPITAYARTQNLDVATRLVLFAQVCDAVSHAHANLVVHRDLKPSNILVTPAGEVCLLDFGIAKLLDQEAEAHTEITRTGARAFTLHYAAPEQLRGEPVTTMTDVYALGVVLYELLTDRKPYEVQRQSDAAWEEAILHAEPQRPSLAALRVSRESGLASDRRRARALAGDLDNIVLKALRKAPDQRYPSVEALAQDLRRYRDGQPVQARAQSFGYRARKYLRRHALGMGLSLGVCIVLAVTLGIVAWQANRAFKEAARAQAMQDFVIALFENTGNSSDGEALDVRALLDAGVRRADTELANQPLARAQLLGLIARLRAGLGDDREALDLLDRQSELLRILDADAPDGLRLEAAALRGRSLRELGRSQECLDSTAPLLGTAQAASAAFPLEVAEYFSQLGRCHRLLRGQAVARDLFGQALQLRRLHSDNDALQAESRADLALLQLDGGLLREAERGLREALDLLRSAGGERNALGVVIWRHLGHAYRRLFNRIEAVAAYRQALEIGLSRFGSNHPQVIAVQGELAEALMQGGQLVEAQRLLELSRDGQQSRWGADSLGLARIDANIGHIALLRDRPADAELALSNSVRIWRQLDRGNDYHQGLCRLAIAQADLRRNAAALTSARDCVAGNAAGEAAEVEAWLAELAASAQDRGDTALARAALALSPPSPRFSPALAFARARLAASDRAAAEFTLANVLSAIAQRESQRLLRWQALAWQAGMACAGGEGSTGRTRLEEVLTQAQATDAENLRLQRRLRQLGSACLGTGKPLRRGVPD
jgi:serine/threonine-protein kinase